MSPLVSIITANYNKANFIEQTIQSVLNQSYSNWEWLIADDASTDNSVEIISSYLNDKRIVLLKNEKNAGGNVRRNEGLREASGEYVVFLDADDILDRCCIENRLKQAFAFPKIDFFVFSMGVFVKAPGDMVGHDWIPSVSDPLKRFLSHTLPWSIMQPLWKRSVLLKLGGFDEGFQRLQDVDLNTRALLVSDTSYKVIGGQTDCYYRIDGQRRNYDMYTFLEKWAASAIRYCDKMQRLAPPSHRKYLVGTIYQTYFQVMYHFKQCELTKVQFESLEKYLLGYPIIQQLGFFKFMLFRVSKFYNLRMMRIPGGNRLLKALLLV